MCMTMVFPQPDSIVTVLVSEEVQNGCGMTAFLVSEQPLPDGTGAPLSGPIAHWSRCVSLLTCYA